MQIVHKEQRTSQKIVFDLISTSQIMQKTCQFTFGFMGDISSTEQANGMMGTSLQGTTILSMLQSNIDLGNLDFSMSKEQSTRETTV